MRGKAGNRGEGRARRTVTSVGPSLAAEASLKPSVRSPSNFMNRCVVKLMDRDKLGPGEWKWEIGG